MSSALIRVVLERASFARLVPAYQAELRRRAVILKEVYGFDFLPDLEALLQPPARR